MAIHSVAALLLLAPLAFAADTISIHLFTDDRCEAPSSITPGASLPLNVCVVTPGLMSFEFDNIACPSGNLHVYAFEDSACGNELTYENPGYCSDPNLQNYIPAIMAACGGIPSPVSTTTITVGDVITAAPVSSTANSVKPANPTSSSTSNTGSANGTPSSDGGSGSSSGWSSLSIGERIGIIVAIAVGVPPILIGLWQIEQRRRRHNLANQVNAAGPGRPPAPMHSLSGSSFGMQSPGVHSPGGWNSGWHGGQQQQYPMNNMHSPGPVEADSGRPFSPARGRMYEMGH